MNRPLVDWYNLLRSPYKEQAIINAREGGSSNSIASCLEEAINQFCWDDTPEGHEYWHDIYESLKEFVTHSIEIKDPVFYHIY